MANATKSGGGFFKGAFYGVVVSAAGLVAAAGLVPLESGQRPVFGPPPADAPAVEVIAPEAEESSSAAPEQP